MHSKLLIFSIVYILCASCSPKNSSYISSIIDQRINNKVELIKGDHAPIKSASDLEKISYFSPDKTYKVSCNFQEDSEKKAFEMATYSGINKAFYTYGEIACPIENDVIRLKLYKSMRQTQVPGFNDLLFLPFKDLTNSVTTYGGGRYIDVKESDIVANKITIDFNNAYNPWCAYGDGFNCPIPPVFNHLDREIRVGEKDFAQ